MGNLPEKRVQSNDSRNDPKPWKKNRGIDPENTTNT